MKAVAISEFKAKLAKYLRIVKSGEDVEIRERGVPVARMTSPRKKEDLVTTPPQRDPRHLAEMKFSVRPKGPLDVVALLREDRDKR